VFRILAIVLFGLIVANTANAQGANPSDDVILRALLPNGTWADTTQIARFKRADEIRALKSAQLTAKDERAVSIIWLLAALKYQYAENRRQLINYERRCQRRPYPQGGECYSLAADRLIDLFRRGDHTLLKYLFDIEPHSDGFLAEVLGGFFSDTLASQPRVFLTALARRPVRQQRGIASAAGIEDGGGMDPERLLAVRRTLRGIVSKSSDPLSMVARTCLKQINIANAPNSHDENN